MKSLANLAEAMKRTRKLCAVMIDSVGRELIINRPTTDEEDGWPTFEAGISVEANQKAWAQAWHQSCSCYTYELSTVCMCMHPGLDLHRSTNRHAPGYLSCQPSDLRAKHCVHPSYLSS